MKQEIKDCCVQVPENGEKKGFLWGILFGILPHTFCILFVLFSIIGASFGAVYFQKLFRIPHLFQYLILLSFVFASISAAIYLKRINGLSFRGIKLKWRYLTILLTTTVAVNLLIFYVVLPVALSHGNKSDNNQAAVASENNVQVVRMTQYAGGYQPKEFTIKKGVPVKWIIDSKAPDTCSGSIRIAKLGINKDLQKGENMIEFTPTERGEIKFSCVMGMYSGKFVVD